MLYARASERVAGIENPKPSMSSLEDIFDKIQYEYWDLWERLGLSIERERPISAANEEREMSARTNVSEVPILNEVMRQKHT
jgi:hypothetical protein